jgi:hypothetical protein
MLKKRCSLTDWSGSQMGEFQRVSEDGARLHEAAAVLSLVYLSLSDIPLELRDLLPNRET